MNFSKEEDKRAEEDSVLESSLQSAEQNKNTPPVAATVEVVPNKLLEDLGTSFKQIDVQVIIKLLKNPLESLRLTAGKDISYGIVGLTSAIVGFLIWVLCVSKQIDDVISGFLRFGAFANVRSTIFGKMFLISIVSTLSLLLAIGIIGFWKSTVRVSIKSLITQIGAVQYIVGAGFIVSGIFALMSFSISVFVLFVTLLSSLLLSITAAVDMYKVNTERRASYIILSISAYILFTALLVRMLL